MEHAAPLAAGVVVPADLVAILGILGIVILAVIAIVLLRHSLTLRRLRELENRDTIIIHRLDSMERERQAEREHARRSEQFQEAIVKDMENVKELLHVIIRGHMRET